LMSRLQGPMMGFTGSLLKNMVAVFLTDSLTPRFSPRPIWGFERIYTSFTPYPQAFVCRDQPIPGLSGCGPFA